VAPRAGSSAASARPAPDASTAATAGLARCAAAIHSESDPEIWRLYMTDAINEIEQLRAKLERLERMAAAHHPRLEAAERQARAKMAIVASSRPAGTSATRHRKEAMPEHDPAAEPSG
jgi:hypothetical protein